MKAMAALLMGLVSLHACIDSDDIGSAEQAEIIEVHGCRPGYWDIGDGICVDPWPGGGGGGGGPTGGESGPGGGGGGGGQPSDHRADTGTQGLLGASRSRVRGLLFLQLHQGGLGAV